MSEPTPKPRHRGKWLLRLLILLLVGGLLAGWYLSSSAFEARLRAIFVARVEGATGGRVETGSFHWDLWSLVFEARRVTLHGQEPASAPPLARVESVRVRLKVLSFFAPSFGAREIVVTRPVVWLVTSRDGSVNLPVQDAALPARRASPARLLELSVDRLDVTGGELVWNDRRFPLEFAARDVALSLAYAAFDRCYDGELTFGALRLRYREAPSFESRARLIFRLWPAAAQITSLQWSSEGSRLEARGRLDDFAHPRLSVDYSAKLDLRELGSLLQLSQLRSGRLEISGQGSGRLDQLSSSGKLRWTAVAWQDTFARLSELAGGAQFTASREQLTVSHLFAHLLGGNLTGSAQVRHWTHWSGRATGLPQEGAADFRVIGVQLGSLAAAVSSEALPFSRLNAAGVMAGTVKAAWRGSLSDAAYEFALDVAPPLVPRPEDWPLTGTIAGLLRPAAATLALDRLQLTTPASRLEAAGALGAPHDSLRFSWATKLLAETRTLLDIFAPSLPLHLEPQGRGAFTGRLSGRLLSPRVEGHLTAANFAVSRPAGPERGALILRFDALFADLDYSSTSLEVRRADLHHGPASIAFDLATGLRHGRFDESAPLRARVELRDAALDQVQSVAGVRYPVRGMLDLRLEVQGTWRDRRGQGSLELRQAELLGEPFRLLTSGVRLLDGELELGEFTLSQNGGRAQGTAAWRFSDRSFRFDLRGSDFDLASFRRLQRPRFSTAGRLAFHLRGRGTAAQPDLTADLRLSDLVLNGEEAGDLEAHAVTRSGALHVTTRSAFRRAEFTAEGQVGLRAGLPAQLSVRFARLDIDPLLGAVVPGRITGHSAVAGRLELAGPLAEPRTLVLDVEISQLAAEVAGVRLESDGPLQFAVRNGALDLRRVRIVGEGTDLSAGGRAEFAGERRLDLRAQGRANFRLLQSLDPNFQASGDASVDLTIGGTVQQPNLLGKLRIADAALAFIDAPNALSDINGEMTFNQNRLQIKSLTARTGGGSLDIGGSISYSRGLFFDLALRGREIRLRHPPGISSVADADLRFVGSAAGSLLSGEVTVKRFGVSPKFDFAEYLAARRTALALPGPGDLLRRMRFDVRIVSTPSLEVQTLLARVSGDVGLRLRGTAAAPAVLGRVNISEGRIVFSGTEYRINQGEVTFSNPVRIEPVLNLDASARVRQYDISIALHGPLDRITANYRSDPPLPTPDIIALLALGRTREEAVLTRQTTDTLGQDEASALLGSALNATLSSRVQKLFGVSRIKIDPQVGGPENNPNARLTIEQQVSPQVTLTYITNLSQSAQQVIQGEFHLSRNVSLVAVRDQNGVLGFELRIRQRKK